VAHVCASAKGFSCYHHVLTHSFVHVSV
jgi:hypothetical protein